MEISDIEFFITDHRYAILPFLLSDKDFELALLHSNKEFRFCPLRPDNILNIPIPLNTLPAIISKEDIVLFINEYIDISRHKKVSFDEEDLYFISNKGEINASELIENNSIILTDRILDKYIDKWNWYKLSQFSNIIWNNDRVEKYSRYIKFKQLSHNTNLDIDETIITKYEEFWDWGALSANPKVLENNEEFMFSHPKTVWVSKPSWNSHVYVKDYCVLNEIYNVEKTSGSGYSSCICTNTGIHWTLEKFIQYSDKIDFWLLASFAKIDIEVIVEFGNNLNVNRGVKLHYYEANDWNYSYTVFRNGWENWVENPNVFLNTQILEKVKNQNVNLVRHEESNSGIAAPYEIVTCVTKLFRGSKINLPLSDYIHYSEVLPNNLITDFHINLYFYHRTIKPALQLHPSVLVSLIECFDPQVLYDNTEIVDVWPMKRR